MKVPYVYEEIEVIIEFYEALCVESTPSRENEICECALKGLTALFTFRILAYWPLGSGVIDKNSLSRYGLCLIQKPLPAQGDIIRDGKK